MVEAGISDVIVIIVCKRLKIWRLEYREKRFHAKQSEDRERYKVLRHVITQADMEEHEGEVCHVEYCLIMSVMVGLLSVTVTDYCLCKIQDPVCEMSVCDNTAQTIPDNTAYLVLTSWG